MTTSHNPFNLSERLVAQSSRPDWAATSDEGHSHCTKYSTLDLLDSILLVIRHFLIYSDMQNHPALSPITSRVGLLAFWRVAERNWLSYISVRKDLTSNLEEIDSTVISDGITVVLWDLSYFFFLYVRWILVSTNFGVLIPKVVPVLL